MDSDVFDFLIWWGSLLESEWFRIGISLLFGLLIFVTITVNIKRFYSLFFLIGAFASVGMHYVLGILVRWWVCPLGPPLWPPIDAPLQLTSVGKGYVVLWISIAIALGVLWTAFLFPFYRLVGDLHAWKTSQELEDVSCTEKEEGEAEAL